MNTKYRPLRMISLLAVIVTASASSFAGPGPQYWNRLKPVTTVAEAQAVKPGDPMVLVCGACKTVSITEFKSTWPNGKGPGRWMEIGTKHSCDNCGGEITVVKGKTTDSMQHNCSKCGDGAAFCCAGMAADSMKDGMQDHK